MGSCVLSEFVYLCVRVCVLRAFACLLPDRTIVACLTVCARVLHVLLRVCMRVWIRFVQLCTATSFPLCRIQNASNKGCLCSPCLTLTFACKRAVLKPQQHTRTTKHSTSKRNNRTHHTPMLAHARSRKASILTCARSFRTHSFHDATGTSMISRHTLTLPRSLLTRAHTHIMLTHPCSFQIQCMKRLKLLNDTF